MVHCFGLTGLRLDRKRVPVDLMKIDRGGLAYIHDVMMTGLAFVLAFYLRVGDELFGFHLEGLIEGLPVVMVTGAVTYRLFGLYRGIWRYASAPDMLQIAKAT